MSTKTTKTTKQELKAILKQCLREILQEEGVILTEGRQATRQQRPAANDLQQQSPPDRRRGTANQPVQNTALMNQINEVANSFGVKGSEQADMFRSILADTAATTLQEQQGAGHSVGADGSGGGGGNLLPSGPDNFAMPSSPQRLAQDERELASLAFGGDTSRWAQVAFAGKR